MFKIRKLLFWNSVAFHILQSFSLLMNGKFELQMSVNSRLPVNKVSASEYELGHSRHVRSAAAHRWSIFKEINISFWKNAVEMHSYSHFFKLIQSSFLADLILVNLNNLNLIECCIVVHRSIALDTFYQKSFDSDSIRSSVWLKISKNQKIAKRWRWLLATYFREIAAKVSIR